MDHIATRPVHLPAAGLLDLEFHLMETRPDLTLEAFLMELLKRWLKLDKERTELRLNGQPIRGFQWKNVFLPEGTNLRTSYRGTVEFAKVVGDHILSADGRPLTPSVFANQHATGRNAWRFIWLRFPGEVRWTRAADCRRNSSSL